MTDKLWVEKPDTYGGQYEHPYEVYKKQDMDAWLEKLKAEFDKLKEKAEKYDEVKAELNRFTLDVDKELEKIEAVKSEIGKIDGADKRLKEDSDKKSERFSPMELQMRESQLHVLKIELYKAIKKILEAEG